MKLTACLFLVSTLTVMAGTSYAQRTKLSLEFKNTPLEDVLSVIEDKSEFYFLYSKKVVDVERKVDISVKDETVPKILDILLAGSKETFIITERQIVLTVPGDPWSPSSSFYRAQQQQFQRTVSGKVTDSEGQALPGVTVVVKGTTQGTVTNADGEYSISDLPDDATLIFSFVGMRTQEIAVGNQSTINVTMVEDIIGIEEVVAVGYGTREKGMLTGSVSNIDAVSIERSTPTNITQALQGKMAGLIINDRGGSPGAEDLNILIRGSHTLGNNSPLIIIDGVPRGGMNQLSPNDIEEISVLKDAAASIYGARAANGVIIIRTKRGKKGKENAIRLNSTYGVSTFTKALKLMDSWQFATYLNEVEEHYGRTKYYTEEDLEKYKSGDFPNTHPNTNWVDVIYDDFAPYTRHNLSASGGKGKVQYFISGDYRQENGHYSSGMNQYDQYQIRSNIDAEVMKYLNIGFDLSGRLEKDHSPAAESVSGIMRRAQITYPMDVAYYTNGRPAYASPNGMTPIKSSSDDAGWNEQIDKIFFSKMSFDLNMDWITKGLSLFGFAAFDFSNINREVHHRPYTLWTYDSENDEYHEVTSFTQSVGNNITLEKYNNSSNNELYHIRLGYDNQFGDHKISAFAAYEQSEYYSENFSAYRRNLYSTEKLELFAGEEDGRAVNGSSSESGRVNYFGNIIYDYMRKYMLEFSLRRDGSFNFPKGKRFGTFPGVSAGWSISKESFMSITNEWLNNLKIRGSWAKMGNDRIPEFQFLTQYILSGYNIFGETPQYYDVMDISNTPNLNITWEISNNWNIGFDATMWERMLSINFDYFFEKRRNILITRSESVPDYTALELPQENLGKVNNSGIELLLNHQNKVGVVNYYISGNFTYNHNEIVYMDEAENIPEYRKKEGHPMHSFVVYVTDGIFNTQEEIENAEATLPGTKPGDLKYVDISKDGIINNNDMIRKYTSPIPEIQFGLNAGMQYKGFELNVLFQGQGNAETMMFNNDQGNRAEVYFTKRWTEDNKDAEFPRPFERSDNFNRESTFHLYNASFIRLKDVELAYNFDFVNKKAESIFKGFRVYLKGFNLWSLDYLGEFNVDPEVNNSMARYYPQLTKFSAGIDVQF